MRISKYAKAIVAAVVAASGTIGTALTDGVVTTGEAWAIAGAVVGALGFTWAVPNRSTAKHAAPSQ